MQPFCVRPNEKDLAAARAAGLEAAMIDRLSLTDLGIATMAEGLEQIIALPDPIGEITNLRYRPNRHTGRTDARTLGRDRDYLRSVVQCDG